MVNLIHDHHKIRLSTISAFVDSLACWRVIATTTHTLQEYSFLDLIRGFISKDLVSSFTQFNLSTEVISKIISASLFKAQRFMHSDIWLPRCERMVAFEKSKNITGKMKKQFKTPSSFNNPQLIQHRIASCSRSRSWISKAVATGRPWQDFRKRINSLFVTLRVRRDSYLTLTVA